MDINPSPPTNAFGLRFRAVVASLLRVTGERARLTPTGYGPALPALELGLVVWVQAYLQRLRTRVMSLLARIEAGTVVSRPYRPRTPRMQSLAGDAEIGCATEAAAGGQRQAGLRPAGFPNTSWLCGVAPYKAAATGNDLEFLLREAEMLALVATNPRLALLLRPLCRALGKGNSVAALTRIIDAAGILPKARRRAWEQEHAPPGEPAGRPAGDAQIGEADAGCDAATATPGMAPAGRPARPARRRKRKLTVSPSRMTTVYFRGL